MASTAHKTSGELQEHFDAPDVLRQKVDLLVSWIKASKHFVAFTGAGCSTAAGIPDFRGPTGVWTLQAQKKPTMKGVNMLKAIPTFSHMSLIELHRRGILKYLISQNVDGLHRRSGFPPEALSELHGNTNREICSKCGKEYLRDFSCRNAQMVHDHLTGRKCSNLQCGGELMDTIINFEENLPEIPMERGFEHSHKADLHLVLGSSLRVSPACDMPAQTVRAGGRLVVCNLQKTPLDKKAALVIHARCDDVMNMVMQSLGLQCPAFILRRHVRISCNGKILTVRAVDVDGTPASIFTQVIVTLPRQRGAPAKLTHETFEVPLPSGCSGTADVQLFFRGNYGEPTLKIPYDIPTEPSTTKLLLEFDACGTREWVVSGDMASCTTPALSEQLDAMHISPHTPNAS